MREIKFRVWDIDDCAYSGNWYALNCLQAMDRDVDYTRAKDRKIVEQYTGLKDKNGKEIYEGDICLHDSRPGAKRGRPIVFDNCRFYLKGKCYTDDIPLVNRSGSSLEIIGNIHEEEK